MTAKYKVEKALILGKWSGEWLVTYYCGGSIDHDVRGTNGLGCKLFSSKEKAEASGKRYLKKMEELGFEVVE